MSITAIEIVNQIGETSGKIFRSLEIKKDQSIADLRKSTKVENIELLNQGIGWLAREGKLNITTNLKGELRISLR